jgi:hypothetical protein
VVDDALPGDFIVKVTGRPTREVDAMNKFKIAVATK